MLVDDCLQNVGTQRYLYHSANEVGVIDTSGELVQYGMLGIGKGAEIGAAVLVELNGEAYVPFHDHHGNIVGLVDAKSGDLFKPIGIQHLEKSSVTVLMGRVLV